MMKRILIVFYLITLMSCSKENMNKSSQNLNIACRMNHPSLHPSRVIDSTDATICKALYEGLTRVNLKGEVELALAEKVELSPCKRIYTITLKDSTWSNGQIVKVHHFIDAWKMSLIKKDLFLKRLFIIRNARKVYEGVSPASDLGLKALDDKTIVIELEHPASYFLQLLAEPAYSPYFNVDEKEPTVFNGPFLVKTFEMEKKLVLEANPLYWDAKTVRLNEIHFHFIDSQDTAMAMYEDKKLDWLGTPLNEFSFEMLQSPNIKVLKTTSPFWIYLNTENEKLKSASIRKALSYSINRSEIVQKVAPYHTELYTPLPTKMSLIDEETPSLQRAQELFEQGLKELGLQKKDFILTINHSNYLEHERLAVYLRDCWKKAFGIQICLRKDEWKTFTTKLRSQDYEIGGCYVCNLYDHPSYLLERFEGEYFSQWTNPDFKMFMEQARHSKEEVEQSKYLKNAETVLLDGMPVIPIYNQSNVFLCRDDLKNVFPPKFMHTDFKWAYFEE